MFNAFEELFAPGRKHTRDEQKRLELTREDVGDNDPRARTDRSRVREGRRTTARL